MKISAIICTHNPRPHYLRRVLEALERQTLAKAEWELLLIDNASTKPLRGRAAHDVLGERPADEDQTAFDLS